MLNLISKPWVASCHETADSMSDYVDGELRGRRLARVRRHLARCERCQALFDSLTRTIDELRALGTEGASPVGTSVAAGVLARIEPHRS